MSVTVTERAAAALKDLLEQQNPGPDQVLRLIYDTDSSVKLVLDTKAADDQVVDHQGQPVMVIEPAISQDLAGTTLDSTGTEGTVALTLQH
jgi:Fe-S cluster assembly iron-binding protein IscA